MKWDCCGNSLEPAFLSNLPPYPRHAKRRFHFKTHVGLRCAQFNNPNHQDNPLLWHTAEDGNPAPNFNSSIAESNNAWLSGKSIGRVLTGN